MARQSLSILRRRPLFIYRKISMDMSVNECSRLVTAYYSSGLQWENSFTFYMERLLSLPVSQFEVMGFLSDKCSNSVIFRVWLVRCGVRHKIHCVHSSTRRSLRTRSHSYRRGGIKPRSCEGESFSNVA